MNRKKSNVVNFIFSEIGICILGIIFGILAYSVLIFIKDQISTYFYDILYTLVTTWISIFALGLILEISSIKKLISNAIESAIKNRESFDFSNYNRKTLSRISENLTETLVSEPPSILRDKKLECCNSLINHLYDFVNERSVLIDYFSNVDIEIDNDLHFKITNQSLYTMICNENESEFYYEMFFTTEENRDSFRIFRFRIDGVDYLKDVIKENVNRSDSEIDRKFGVKVIYKFKKTSHVQSFKVDFIFKHEKNGQATPSELISRHFINNYDLTISLKDPYNKYELFVYPEFAYRSFGTDKLNFQRKSFGSVKGFQYDGWLHPGSGYLYGLKLK